ncbi:MAG: response regulator [Acidimicrobiaceae bacterium]|nr:response regulator [Acidimicrobiaceae bacterium]
MTKILVADDDPDILELVSYKLTQSGYEVTTVTDGKAAIEKAKEIHPDLVILDVMMPFHSGIEVTIEIRNDPDMTNTPIILLTAKSMEMDTERGFAAGATDYMTKPFSPRELASRVQAILGRTS